MILTCTHSYQSFVCVCVCVCVFLFLCLFCFFVFYTYDSGVARAFSGKPVAHSEDQNKEMIPKAWVKLWELTKKFAKDWEHVLILPTWQRDASHRPTRQLCWCVFRKFATLKVAIVLDPVSTLFSFQSV